MQRVVRDFRSEIDGVTEKPSESRVQRIERSSDLLRAVVAKRFAAHTNISARTEHTRTYTRVH